MNDDDYVPLTRTDRRMLRWTLLAVIVFWALVAWGVWAVVHRE